MMLSNMKLVAAVALLYGMALTGIATETRAQHVHTANPAAALNVGAAAPSFDVHTLDGKMFTLEGLRGRPLVLNFFASWCDPCRDEMPIVNDIAARAAKDNFTVLGIAIEDTRAGAVELAREFKITFPIALDLNSKVKRAYRIFGPPATFFIDGQGVIRDVVLGPISAERARTALRKINATGKT